MSTRLDVIYPREYKARDGTKQTHWMKCGVAFPNDKGIDVILYVVPPAIEQSDGSMGHRVVLREPMPARDDVPRTSRPMVETKRQPGGFGGKKQQGDDGDDPLPF